MKSVFSLVTLLLLSSNALAGLHKWVDADGKVHYSDTPPPEVSTQTVRNVAGKGQADAPASYSPKSVAEREAELRKAKQGKEEAAQKKAQETAAAETKTRNCEAARQNARALEEGTRIVTYDANGEKTFMEDDTRAQRLDEARQAISANCN